jgi:hypothetical protein
MFLQILKLSTKYKLYAICYDYIERFFKGSIINISF